MQPPALATWLLRLLARSDDRRFLLDDLRDEFDAIARAGGRAAASRWYWRQALASIGPLAATRLPDAPRVSMLGHHLRHSLRLLGTSPGSTAVAVLTLALGIGANTAVFSVVDAVLLQPLPYRAPQRLMSIWQTRAGERLTVGLADFVDYRRRSRAFEDLAAHTGTTAVILGGTAPEEAPGDIVTWNLFTMLGAQPALGRAFAETDSADGAPRTVVLSDAFWRRRFGSDPAMLGRTVILSNAPHVVIGIMPRDFRAPSQFTTGTPVAFFLPAPEITNLDAVRGDRELRVLGRLRDGVSPAQAQDDVRRIDEDLAKRYPASNAAVRAGVAPLADDVTRNVRISLLVVFAAVALVVLIASLNVANLLIVRAAGQRQEVAIRVALGASRADIIADYLARGLTLAALGGLCGLVFGAWARDLLVAAAPSSIPRLDGLTLNPQVFGATACLSLATGVIAGLIPALQVTREKPAGGLKVAESATSGSSSLRRWQGTLMACEIAAAVVIALGAGLLVRSLIVLNGVDLGFQTERVLTFRLRPSGPRYADATARLAFFQDVFAGLIRIPGVRAVAFANDFPLRGGWGGSLLVEGPGGPTAAEADFQAVSATYFSTLGIPLLRGRLLSEVDRLDAPPAVVVSQTFATRLMPGRDPIGVQIRRNRESPPLTIVGVVGEIRRDGKFADTTPQVFFSAYQTGLYAVRLDAVAVRSATTDPRLLIPAIQGVIASLEPALPMTRVRTLDEILSASVATRRFNMLLLTSFAALALVLAIVGVYGVVAHAALQRTREIGIRMALGATRASAVGLIVRATLRWTIPGLALGLLSAWGSTRVMATMLFGITPNDPATFGLVTALMLIVSVLASCLPARRAGTIDPIIALRAH